MPKLSNRYNLMWFLFEKAWQSFCAMHCKTDHHHPLCLKMKAMIEEEQATWKTAEAAMRAVDHEFPLQKDQR